VVEEVVAEVAKAADKMAGEEGDEVEEEASGSRRV
jgi:hypothetical protein